MPGICSSCFYEVAIIAMSERDYLDCMLRSHLVQNART